MFHHEDHPHFTIHNLPYGIYSTSQKNKRAGVAIGDFILDLAQLFALGKFPFIATNVFANNTLNDFIALGKEVHLQTRKALQDLISTDAAFLSLPENTILDLQADAVMHVPVHIGDYTDFYSSEEHASNVGKMFRPTLPPLMPNWKHMPIAYHGRSSSIITTHTDIKRPSGQILQGETPVYGESKTLDIEIELGFIIGQENKLGDPIPITEANQYLFGVVLLNDFSARDIQRWEYQPLGPFLGKNFATSISPWVVTYEALKPFLTAAPHQDPEVLDYLKQTSSHNFDIQIQFDIETENNNRETASTTNSKFLYWTVEQQITHHTVNGCNLRIGDLLGTGTISGKEKNSFGSLLEITWNGKENITIGSEDRTFLQDGDTTILTGICKNDSIQIGFGELRNKIVPR